MAEKRMFSKKIIRTDRFLEMPQTARLLYYDLSMEADDDGFVDNPRSVMKLTNASEDDMKLLIAKSFLILFPPGLVVIKDWRINNYIQNDRYHPTIHEEEKKMLISNKNSSYELVTDTTCIQNGSSDKIRLDKNRIDKNNICSLVVSYLNEKAGTHYRENIESTKRLITARINQGFTTDDFYKVIDTKCSQWLNNEMKKYLRPETLFGSKFEGYLNETTTQKPKTALDTFSEEEQQ